MTSGCKLIDHLNIGLLWGPLVRATRHHGEHDETTLFKLAAVILAKRAVVGLLRSATFAEFSLGDYQPIGKTQGSCTKLAMAICSLKTKVLSLQQITCVTLCRSLLCAAALGGLPQSTSHCHCCRCRHDLSCRSRRPSTPTC